MDKLTLVFAAMMAWQLKHFICDYPGQTTWMLGKFKTKGWALPLAAHAAVHAAFTFGLSVLFMGAGMAAVYVALLDFAIHFTMDRVKASGKMMGRWKALSAKEYAEVAATIAAHESGTLCYKPAGIKTQLNSLPHEEYVAWYDQETAKYIESLRARIRSNKLFWWALGFDQLVHHITDIVVIWLLVHP